MNDLEQEKREYREKILRKHGDIFIKPQTCFGHLSSRCPRCPTCTVDDYNRRCENYRPRKLGGPVFEMVDEEGFTRKVRVA